MSTSLGLVSNGGRKRTSVKKRPESERRERYSITLSKKSSEAFDWLKTATDADTDSEVIRNALRLHYVLLQRHLAGDAFFIRKADGGELTQIDLFIPK
jgi:hypothetical protein